jgi:hypothetical protein
VTFRVANALRVRPLRRSYSIVWSAGLFDYFSDRAFVFMLKRLKPLAEREIIIGNFAPIQPDRAYMQLLDWQLVYRSPQRLMALARAAGFDENKVWIGREPTGLNLFLHLTA